MSNRFGTVTSRDGTSIAFEHLGDGPPLILVVGAFNDRSAGAALAHELSDEFAVYLYDRRGRGDSGDNPPYAVEREIEDLDALIGIAGGNAAVLGFSSGAALALAAGAARLPISRLILYDLPLMLEERGPRWTVDHASRLAELVLAGRRGDAVEYFQRDLVGIPDAVVAQMRHAPFRPALEAIAHTLVYEATILGDGLLRTTVPAEAPMPLLAVVGAQMPPFMVETAHALGSHAPQGRSLVLESKGHDIDPQVLAPVITEFLGETGGAP